MDLPTVIAMTFMIQKIIIVARNGRLRRVTLIESRNCMNESLPTRERHLTSSSMSFLTASSITNRWCKMRMDLTQKFIKRSIPSTASK